MWSILAVLLCLSLEIAAAMESGACRLFVSMSSVKGAGRGVFAGQNIDTDGIIEDGVSITIRLNDSLFQLSNYVYESDDDDRSLLIFGVAMMLNHQEDNNAGLFWRGEAISYAEQEHYSYAFFTPTSYDAMKYIAEGDEIFTHYGDNWFTERGFDANLEAMLLVLDIPTDSNFDLMHPLEEKVLSTPIADADIDEKFCLSDVYVGNSLIQLAGKGLFSGVVRDVGDVVTISPVLLLSKKEVAEASDVHSVLINYCICEPDALGDVALLPIGWPGLINHASATAPHTGMKSSLRSQSRPPNARIEWLLRSTHGPGTEDTVSLPLLLSYADLHNPLLTASMLSNMSFAPLDIAIRAIRPIAIDEEITIDYGSLWVQAFETDSDVLLRWLDQCSARGHHPGWESHIDIEGDVSVTGDEDCQFKPLFRHPLGAPVGMFPSHWLHENCLSTSCGE